MRLILTMLALFAGFGAAPVQARIAAPDAAGVERVERAIGVAAIAYAAAEVRGKAGTDCPDREPRKPRPPVTTIVVIPSIQFGDRVRE